VQTSLGHNVDLNGGISAGIVDRPGVDLGNRHNVRFLDNESVSSNVKVQKRALE
jgi:hypothetical protein